MKVLNCCVVCYRNVNSLSSSKFDEREEGATAIFIKLFQRHINFSLESSQITISSDELTFCSTNGRNNAPIKLQACESCSEMLSSFNSSYGDLRCAEMKANWSLKKLANVIRFTDYAPARRTSFRESVNELAEDNLIIDDAIKIITRFRKQIQHQCLAHYQNQFPQVILLKSSQGTKDRINDKGPSKRWIGKLLTSKSKNDLLSAIIKNLSSLQLILYLALFNSVLRKKADVSSSKHQTSFSCDAQGASHPKGHKNTFENLSPSSPVCSLNDEHGFEDVDTVEYSLLDQEADNVAKSDSISIRANEESDLGSGEHVETVAELTNTQYRIRIIKNRTTHSCLSCQLEFASETKLQQHFETCSKTDATDNSNDNVEVKQEPLEIPIPSKNRNTSLLRKDSNKYRCEQCGRLCGNAINLRYHKKIHLGPDSWKYSCSYCGKKFILKAHMKSHIRIHTGEKPYKCSVNDCNKAFSQLNHLKKHKKSCQKNGTKDHNLDLGEGTKGHLEPNSMEYSCSICGEKFASNSKMKVHKRTHPKIIPLKPFKCPAEDCKITFSHLRSLRRHWRKRHKNETDDNIRIGDTIITVKRRRENGKPPFLCTHCGKVCKGAWDLRRHELTHLRTETEDMNYSCSYCGKKFFEKWKMTSHLRVHTERKSFKCPVDDCKMTFLREKGLQLHQQKYHTNETDDTNQNGDKAMKTNSMKTLNIYLCKECGKGFKFACDLRRHELIHLAPDSWKYSCSYCGKKFSLKDKMKVHLRVHTGEKPYKCQADGCEMPFSHSESLRKHQKNIHKTDIGKSNSKILCNKPCGQCGKVFKTRWCLRRHELTHLGTGEKKYPCSHCGKVFKTRWCLRRHELTHAEKKYSCSHCGKKFSFKTNMKRHLKNSHGREIAQTST